MAISNKRPGISEGLQTLLIGILLGMVGTLFWVFVFKTAACLF
jgi:hypothetical protein